MQAVRERTTGTTEIVAIADQYATQLVDSLPRVQSAIELHEVLSGTMISFLTEVLNMVTADV